MRSVLTPTTIDKRSAKKKDKKEGENEETNETKITSPSTSPSISPSSSPRSKKEKKEQKEQEEQEKELMDLKELKLNTSTAVSERQLVLQEILKCTETETAGEYYLSLLNPIEKRTLISRHTASASETQSKIKISILLRQNLKFIPIEVWKKFHRESDDNAKDNGEYSQPTKVIMSPDGRKFGLSPLPDKAYRIYFYAWEQLEPFSLHSDVVLFPEQWTSILLSKARYYIWHFKENIELANLALEEYRKGIRLMRAHTGKPQPSVMTDDRIRFV